MTKYIPKYIRARNAKEAYLKRLRYYWTTKNYRNFNTNIGEIYEVDFGENVGTEFSGRHLAVCLNDTTAFEDRVLVIPITTKIHRSKGFPTHVLLDHMGGLDEESASMAEQITTISRDKLVRYIGSLTENFMATKIDKTLNIQLGLKADSRTYTKKQAADHSAESCEVPIWHKASLTVDEAAAYTNIGVNRIRELCKVPYNKFTFQVGRKILIKREVFDKYLREVEAL